MSLAMGHFERLLLDGRLVHDNPVLSTCIAHTTVRTDATATVRLTRRPRIKSTARSR
jgi:hypothetical protein